MKRHRNTSVAFWVCPVDVLLKLSAKDVEQVNDFVVDFLRQIPAVDRTLTMFVMEEFLSTLVIRGLIQSQTRIEV